MTDYANQGYLYPNHRKTGNAPDMTGKITPVCPHCGLTHEHRVSAWKKQKGGDTMLSLAVKSQEEHEKEKSERKPLPREKDYTYTGPPKDLPDELPGMEGEIPY